MWLLPYDIKRKMYNNPNPAAPVKRHGFCWRKIRATSLVG